MWIETGGWLIEEENVGIVDQRASDGESLLLTARQAANAVVALFFQRDQRDDVADRRPAPVEAAEDAYGFFDRRFLGDLGFLKLDAEAFAQGAIRLRASASRPLLAEDAHGACAGIGESFEDLDGSCFARAVRSQQAEAFAGLDAQIHGVDSGEIAVPFHKSFDENRRLSART